MKAQQGETKSRNNIRFSLAANSSHVINEIMNHRIR